MVTKKPVAKLLTPAPAEDHQQTLRELRGSLRIDRNALDEEIAEQPDLFYRAAEAHAFAVSRRDEAKASMDEAFALASDHIRRMHEKNNAKLTEAMVKELANQDADYNEAVNLYLEAKKTADLYAGLRESLDQRGKMLREMAQLYCAGYYQVVSVGGGVRSKVNEDALQRSRQALNESRQARARNVG
jgi:hypothetical protein